MGIHDSETLLQGPLLGALFETATVLDHIKWASYHNPASTLSAREIKSSRTLSTYSTENLLKAETLLKKPLEKTLLAPVEKPLWISKDIQVQPWHRVEW